MSEDVTRGGQKFVTRSHGSADFELKNVQINLAEDLILRKSDEIVDYGFGKDVTTHFRVVPNVRNELAVVHVVVTVTEPTSVWAINACPSTYGRMSAVFWTDP
jgi:hypothetical protein